MSVPADLQPRLVADDAADDVPVSLTRWQHPSAGVIASTLVHGFLAFLMALWILPEVVLPPRLQVFIRNTDEQAYEALSIETSIDDLPFRAAPTAAHASKTSDPASLALPMTANLATPSRIDPTRVTTPPPVTGPPLHVPASADLTQSFRPVRRSDPAAGGLVVAQSVGGALDGILCSIRTEVGQEMLQVIWLMDASLSLHIDRQEIAARLLPFYKEMIARPDRKEKPLRSGVVSFGAQPAVLQRSTDNMTRIVDSIRGMPADPTGLENVFTAVQFTLETFGRWEGATMIVIWTDESGDDLPLLEDTIRLCRAKGTIVHVVGPQAVLGMEQGLQRYVLPQTQQAFLLPVKRGPDAALPERLRLPYWFDSTSPPWTQGGAYVALGPQTYGGPLREGLLSGVGPYALTRLALETGGTFSVLQRLGEAPPVEWNTQRLYLPDYGHVRDILSDVQRSPLRQAVVEAAGLTWRADLRPPTRVFFGQASEEYPYTVRTPYIPPAVFQLTLKTEIPGHLARAEQDQQIVEAALALMDPVRLATAYESETSPRWRAWYDLNAGRLLAMSVRLAEYRATLQLVLNGVGVTKNTNNITLIEAGQYKSGRVAEARAQLARQHLQKVTSEHAGTPWAKLAEWELQHELGFVVRPLEIPMPPPAPATPARPARPSGGRPSLPNL